mmetsp:Transcript_30710/g.52446  ORF Transcript_30710/g.52446 Transcript_30710/m.52446 type:complete len:116 (+) Transcript_30710:741-1088(+)
MCHVDALRDSLYHHCGVGGAQVCERNIGVCGCDLYLALHLHVEVDALREQEAGVFASTEHKESFIEGTILLTCLPAFFLSNCDYVVWLAASCFRCINAPHTYTHKMEEKNSVSAT